MKKHQSRRAQRGKGSQNRRNRIAKRMAEEAYNDFHKTGGGGERQ